MSDDTKSPVSAVGGSYETTLGDDDTIFSPTDTDVPDGWRRRQSFGSDNTLPAAQPLSGPEHAPIPVEPDRDAEKEVVSSWQTESRTENLPIAINHAPSAVREALYTEAKGEPPSYDSIEQSSDAAAASSRPRPTSPLAIEPDHAAATLPPRPEDKSTVGQLLSWMPHAPSAPPSTYPRLAQPIIIPQIDVPPSGEITSFARCYSEALATHNVTQRDFLSFLDNLALAIAPNSALQGLRVFSVGVSRVPLPLLPLAGLGLKALADSGSGHDSSRTRLYLERTKGEYFAPRGLRMTVIRDDDLHQRLNLPSHTARLAPLTKPSLSDSLCKRRFEALSPYVAPLRFNVPDPDRQIQGVQRMAQKQLESRIKRDRRRLDQLREKQWQNLSTPQMTEWTARYVRLGTEVRRLQERLVGLAGMVMAPQLEAERREVVDLLEEKLAALQLLVAERHASFGVSASTATGAETEEEGWARRLRWIVIENA